MSVNSHEAKYRTAVSEVYLRTIGPNVCYLNKRQSMEILIYFKVPC